MPRFTEQHPDAYGEPFRSLGRMHHDGKGIQVTCLYRACRHGAVFEDLVPFIHRLGHEADFLDCAWVLRCSACGQKEMLIQPLWPVLTMKHGQDGRPYWVPSKGR